QWVIVYPWVTEEQFARGMEQVGPLYVGPNFSLRYRVEGARLVDGETADIKVAYLLGSAEQVQVFDMDFSRPNGIGRFRGTQSARFLERTQEIRFKRIDGEWKFDMGRPNSLGLMIGSDLEGLKKAQAAVLKGNR